MKKKLTSPCHLWAAQRIISMALNRKIPSQTKPTVLLTCQVERIVQQTEANKKIAFQDVLQNMKLTRKITPRVDGNNIISDMHLNTFSLSAIGNSLLSKNKICPNQGANYRYFLRPLQKKTKVLNIIGSKGSGKSTSLKMLKYLFDIRIPFILKNGAPTKTIFEENVKLFLFHFQLTVDQVISAMLSQIQADFGAACKDLREKITEKDFEKFLLFVKRLYEEKNIKVRVIIDDIDELSCSHKKEKQQLIQSWKKMGKFFRPLITISSKNNFYVEEGEDPVVLLSGSSEEPKLKNIYLENETTCEDRLSNTIDCLFFQLQNKKISRSRALRIIQGLGELPILTHQQIIKSLQQFDGISELAKAKGARLNKALVNKLRQLLINSKDLTFFQKNISQLKVILLTSKITQIQKSALEKLVGLLDYSTKNYSTKAITVSLQYDNQRCKTIQITKTKKFIKRNLKTGIKNQASRLISYQNFFQDQKRQLICTLSQSQLLKINHEISYNLTWQVLQKIRLDSPESVRQTAKRLFLYKGQIFQMKICSIFDEKIFKPSQIKVQTQIIIKDAGVFQLKVSQAIRSRISFDGELQSQALKEYVKTITDTGREGTYIRASQGNMCFDFILTKCEGRKLSIFLVDVSFGNDRNVLQKISRFYSVLLKNPNFRTWLEKMSEQPQFQSINLHYFILRAQEHHYPTPKVISASHQLKYKNEKAIYQIKKSAKKIMQVTVDLGHLGKEFSFCGDKDFEESIDLLARELNKTQPQKKVKN